MAVMTIPTPKSKLVSIEGLQEEGAFSLLLRFLLTDIGFESDIQTMKARLREWAFEQGYDANLLTLVGTLLIYLHAHTSVLVALRVISQHRSVSHCEYNEGSVKVYYK